MNNNAMRCAAKRSFMNTTEKLSAMALVWKVTTSCIRAGFVIPCVLFIGGTGVLWGAEDKERIAEQARPAKIIKSYEEHYKALLIGQGISKDLSNIIMQYLLSKKMCVNPFYDCANRTSAFYDYILKNGDVIRLVFLNPKAFTSRIFRPALPIDHGSIEIPDEAPEGIDRALWNQIKDCSPHARNYTHVRIVRDPSVTKAFYRNLLMKYKPQEAVPIDLEWEDDLSRSPVWYDPAFTSENQLYEIIGKQIGALKEEATPCLSHYRHKTLYGELCNCERLCARQRAAYEEAGSPLETTMRSLQPGKALRLQEKLVL